jgi:hypothetical protein
VAEVQSFEVPQGTSSRLIERVTGESQHDVVRHQRQSIVHNGNPACRAHGTGGHEH